MRYVVAALATLLVATGALNPAGAIDHGSMGRMGPRDTADWKTHITEEFPPMAGVYAGQASPAQPYSLYNSWGCANYSYCNRHIFEVEVPKGYLESLKDQDIVTYGVRVTLTWPDPANNDLDLFAGWKLEDPASDAPGGPCSTPEDEECDNLKRETFNVIEPKPEDDPSTEEDESKLPATVYMSVVNHNGVNTGYTLDLQWFLVPFESFPEFQPPKGREVSRPVTQSRTPAPFDETGGNAQPDGDTKILIPGPDGELIEQELDFYAAGNRVPSDPERSNAWVWITSAAISTLAVIAFVYFVIQRRRREAI